ncbi:hypothetical protein LJC18_02130 [Lachnospiraceae bacterium OttesenSCG-928-E19]|nr:hypothetical protein [Lachnospiraceae bacterium OttesenSCG-928-E19]
MQKIEYIGGDDQVVINNPNIHYSYIYAPNAISINVASVETVFCGPNTNVLTPCDDVRRGQWYIKKGSIRSKLDPDFAYKLHFNEYNGLDSMSGLGRDSYIAVGDAQFQIEPIPMKHLDNSIGMLESLKEIEICKQKIIEQKAGKEVNSKQDSPKVQLIKNTFDNTINKVREISIKSVQNKK